jgi:signal peptidase II
LKDLIKIKRLPAFSYILYSVIIALGIGADQLTKLLAVKFLMPIDTLPIIKGVIHLTYVENRGAAFGMLADHRYVFMIVSTVMIAVLSLVVYLGMCENKGYCISLCLIISGGIGNMIDRIALGYVVDFIDFRLINFAVFNGADSFVCVGAALLAIFMIIDTVREEKKLRTARDTHGKGEGKP